MSNQVKTVPMLRAELSAIRIFMQTEPYQQYLAELRSTRDEATREVLSLAPNSIGDFVQREQSIGSGRVAEQFLTWFEDQVATLESLIKELEAPPLDQ